MKKVIHWIEYIGGARDDPPAYFPVRHAWWIFGFWWVFLLLLIACFCGQSSKFIYIDF